jgi:hypothetical protein
VSAQLNRRTPDETKTLALSARTSLWLVICGRGAAISFASLATM